MAGAIARLILYFRQAEIDDLRRKRPIEKQTENELALLIAPSRNDKNATFLSLKYKY